MSESVVKVNGKLNNDLKKIFISNRWSKWLSRPVLSEPKERPTRLREAPTAEAGNAAGKYFAHLLINDKFSTIHTQDISCHPLRFGVTQQPNGFRHIFCGG